MREFEIPGKLPGLNEYIDVCRRNPYKGNRMKQEAEKVVSLCIKRSLKSFKPALPVHISYLHAEPNKRRDKDNVASFSMKVIQDALVNCKIIPNDGWNEIESFSNDFCTDKKNPHISVRIYEKGEWT